MTPIKDIGKKMFCNVINLSFYDTDWVFAEAASKGMVLNVTEVIVNTPEERRELVRRVWADSSSNDFRLEERWTVDKYIKEQGL